MRSAIIAATAAATMVGGVAFADGVNADGDTTEATGNLQYGDGAHDCATRGTAVAGSVTITYNGNDHYATGEPLNVQFTEPAGVDSAIVAGTYNVPANWGNSNVKSYSIPFTTTVSSSSLGGKVDITVTGATSGYAPQNGASFNVNVSCGTGTPSGDTTPPSIELQEPAADFDGWHGSSPVTVRIAASDNSGSIADISCTDAVDATAAVPATVQTDSTGPYLSVAGSGIHQLSCTAKDAADNSATDTEDVKIDVTKPTLGVTAASATTFDICTEPSRPSFVPSDSHSGVDSDSSKTYDSWSGPGTGVLPTYTYSAQAYDNVGNNDSFSRTYTAVYGSAWQGIEQPINSDGSSRFKLGSTVPVKFRLMCGTQPISNAVATLQVAQGDTVPDAGESEAISTAASTSGNRFRYDASGQQYIFNLSTKSGFANPGGSIVNFSTGTWNLYINLNDGTAMKKLTIQLPR